MKKILLIAVVLTFCSTKMNGMLGGFCSSAGDIGLTRIDSDSDLAEGLKDFLNAYEQYAEKIDKNSEEYTDVQECILRYKELLKTYGV